MSIKDRLFVLGRKLPTPVAQSIKYLYYSATLRRKERHWRILNSIPKSGTKFFWIFFANYLQLVDYGFFWRRATGLDNLTWWLVDKPSGARD